MPSIDDVPAPTGELSLQTIAMPKDTNADGDIYGGWLVCQMDMAGALAASKIARGRVATVAIDRMGFMVPVEIGDVVSCYTEVTAIGRSSIQVSVEVWTQNPADDEAEKVTDGGFVFVAIDNNGRTRSIPEH